ncbi:MAG: acyltransferase family protein [Cyanobacteria bacterium SZAS TMP-1]|nr:acyltransferase family protein [Cyanobacteria bacterium SZAS TMP-1]
MHFRSTGTSSCDTLRASLEKRYGDRADAYGYNIDTVVAWNDFFRFFYEGYFDVQIVGLENIPDEGRGVLVGNHSGGLPIDAMLLLNGYLNKHPCPRRVRALAHNWLRSTNIISQVICGLGAVPARFDTAIELLNQDELVMFYPEGARGTGKLYVERYRLLDFDPGFVKAAILTQAPIIPVTTVGCDDIYPILAEIKPLARLLHMPYFPITPMFPWLPYITACVPLPAKILIKIGKPVHLPYGPDRVNDRQLRLHLAREFQHRTQREVNSLFASRKSVFAGWSEETIAELRRQA